MSYGDGNGLIQGYDSASYIDGGSFGGEITMFFLHLSQAGLINGMYGAGGADVIIQGATPTGGSFNGRPRVSVTTTANTVGKILPQAKLGQGNFFTVGSVNGMDYFALTGITVIDTVLNATSSNNLTPTDAYAIDKKNK